MKRILLATVTLAVFAASSPALAQHRPSHYPAPHAQKHHAGKPQMGHHRAPQARAKHHHRRWQQGHRFDRKQRHVVIRQRDYRRHNLRKPSRGQQWVQVDNDFLLVSVATGVIASFLTR